VAAESSCSTVRACGASATATLHQQHAALFRGDKSMPYVFCCAGCWSLTPAELAAEANLKLTFKRA
jgi:hypothetical protein